MASQTVIRIPDIYSKSCNEISITPDLSICWFIENFWELDNINKNTIYELCYPLVLVLTKNFEDLCLLKHVLRILKYHTSSNCWCIESKKIYTPLFSVLPIHLNISTNINNALLWKIMFNRFFFSKWNPQIIHLCLSQNIYRSK